MNKEFNVIRAEIVDIFKAFPSGIFDLDILNRLKELEIHKNQYLDFEEKTWRLKSRAIWLAKGKCNTKFFHKFADDHKARNMIWELFNSKGSMISSYIELSKEGESYFKSLSRDQGLWTIDNLLKVGCLFPSYFSAKDNEKLEEPITELELKATLSGFQRSKSLEPNGWTLDFFESFVNLINDDLIRALNEWRVKGCYEPNTRIA